MLIRHVPLKVLESAITARAYTSGCTVLHAGNDALASRCGGFGLLGFVNPRLDSVVFLSKSSISRAIFPSFHFIKP